MPIDKIIVAVGKTLLYETFRGSANGLAKGLAENVAKLFSGKKKKESSNSSAIVQQAKEQSQWIKAQSEYLKRREERDGRLEKLQAAQLESQAYIAGGQAQREERALQLKQDELRLQANIAASQGQREERALQLKQEQLEIQQQDLQDRRELACLQRELMRELHAQTVEVKLTEIQTIWDLENWFSKLSRQETEEILRKGQQQYRLLVLASPPDISEDCPESFRNNLKIEIQNKLKDFLHLNYPLNPGMGNFSPCPVEFYGDYFKEPISDIRVKQLHKLLAPIPTMVLYSQISDYEVNFHLGYWGLHDDRVSLLPIQAWDWEQAKEELEEAGFDEKKSLRIVRQIIVMFQKLLVAFVADLYYLSIDATASYEPRLFELEGEFAQEWFPQELVRDYVEMLREVQQRQRDAYEAELERLKRLEMLAKFTPMDAPQTGLPVTIITGLLGSGKTTLLNHIIYYQKSMKTGVLVGKSGEIGINNDLIEEIEAIDKGCPHCGYYHGDEHDALPNAVYKVLERPEKFDYLVVETNGSPLSVALTFLGTELKDMTRLDSIIAVVDASNYNLDLLNSETEAYNQIIYSDIILLNKVDLVEEADVDLLETKIREIKKDVRIIWTKNAQVSLSLILSVGLFESDKYYQPPQEPQSHKEEHYHYDDKCSYYYLEHDEFTSFSFQSDRPFSIHKFQNFLDNQLSENIFRVKGIMWFEESPLKHIFHMSGKRFTIDDDEWKGKRKNQLVFIGQKFDYDELRSNLENCLV